MSHSFPRVLVPETQRCVQIFVDESSVEWARLPLGDDGQGTLEDDIACQLEINPSNIWDDFENGGGGQGQTTTSATQTRSRDTPSLNSWTGSGVGGSEPPEDGCHQPLIPDREHQGDADIDDGYEDIPLDSLAHCPDNRSDDTPVIPRCVAGVTCNYCTNLPKTVGVYFSGETRNGFLMGIDAFCSQDCAEKGKKGNQVVIPVNLWNTETCSWRPCASCLVFQYLPFTVCQNCKAYMCGNCSIKCKQFKGYYKCPLQCPDSSGINIFVLPASIAGPARLETVELESPVTADQGREEAGVIQRMLQWTRHQRRQLQDEHRRLNESNFLQDLFPAERPLVESSASPLSSHILDESDDHGIPARPPTEEYHTPAEESSVQQEMDDPVVDISEEEPLQQQEIPTTPPAPTKIEGEDEDEGCEIDAE